MNLFRRELGGGRLLQRGGIYFVAVRHVPDACRAARGRPQRLHQCDLPIERWIDLRLHDPCGAGLPVTGDVLRSGPLRHRLRKPALGRRRRAELRHLQQREVEREVGCQIAARGFLALIRRVLIQSLGKRAEPVEIGLAILGIVDGVGGVQEVGRREIAAALLKDGEGTLHPVELEAVIGNGPRLERIEHNFSIKLRACRERDGIHRLHRCDRLLQVGARSGLSGSGVVRQLMLQRRVRALVHAQ